MRWPNIRQVDRSPSRHDDENVLAALLHAMDVELREKYPDIFARADAIGADRAWSPARRQRAAGQQAMRDPALRAKAAERMKKVRQPRKRRR